MICILSWLLWEQKHFRVFARCVQSKTILKSVSVRSVAFISIFNCAAVAFRAGLVPFFPCEHCYDTISNLIAELYDASTNRRRSNVALFARAPNVSPVPRPFHSERNVGSCPRVRLSHVNVELPSFQLLVMNEWSAKTDSRWSRHGRCVRSILSIRLVNYYEHL